MKKIFILLFVLMFSFTLMERANAGLIDYSIGADHFVYDSDLNITWFDYALSGSQGGMAFWSEAMSWSADLNVGGVTGWRLPRVLPVNGSAQNAGFSYNGSTDYGYNLSAPSSAYPGSKSSEMAYLYYNELGNKATYDINGNPDQPGYGLVNVGPFTTLQQNYYWSSTVWVERPEDVFAFGFHNGNQAVTYNLQPWLAMAVHDGDILNLNPVPEPATMLLLGSGLAGLAVVRRKKAA